VVDLFEAQVDKTPYFPAISNNGTDITYQALNEKVNQFSHWLLGRKVCNGDFIGLLLDPGIDYIVCMLAISKVGAIYVPLDSLAPKRRLTALLADANPKLVITDEQYSEHLNKQDFDIHLIKNLHLESLSYPFSNPKHSVKAHSPIYMMYTSGSTGLPKGVIISHQAVVNLVKVDNFAKVKEKERVAQFSNLAFDGNTFEIWSALLNGATLVIIPFKIRMDHSLLKQFFNDNAITYLFLPTGYFHQLIRSAKDTLNAIRVIIFGGEQVNTSFLKEFMAYRKNNKLPVGLINGYGPTEATTFTCRHVMDENGLLDESELASIGTPISNVTLHILDESKAPTVEGELHISGINLAIGYHKSPLQNEQKFIPNPFCSEAPFDRLYKTGDKVRRLPSGKLLFLGRLDDQVKIGGFRIHLNEIEDQLMQHPLISLATVQVEIGGGEHRLLTAYIVSKTANSVINADEIRDFLSHSLPAYMLPAKYVLVKDLPLTSVGKVDKTKLNQIPHIDLSCSGDTAPSLEIEEQIKSIWQDLLNRTTIDVNKNLFELGANSLLITEACFRINNVLQSQLQVAMLVAYPTIHKLSRYLEGDIDLPSVKDIKGEKCTAIAIIGMACRFPKSKSLDEYWDNLCRGEDCLERFSNKELAKLNNPHIGDKNFVPVRGILADIEQFDANFFGFSPTDASITDPQQRLFLECAWEALEHAAVVPSQMGTKTISVFAGMSDSTYLQENLLKNSWVRDELDRFQQRIASSIGMLSTQVSYRLNLKGRSLNINTACSTGLVAVAQACQDLMMGTSDIALAGAVSITVPQIDGYVYKQGGIESPNGQCHPFESRAGGTVFSNGAGVVILKRLDEALADNDTIYAVIKGVGVSNDGSNKLGYTAPSVDGQIACIREALMRAQVKADDVGYIEAHGTATALGDAVEIQALSSVFAEQTDKKHYCALGSVKGNIGHTDVAAGMSGLIKTILCLYYKKIPPMPHFETPNPTINFEESPFFINQQLINWPKEANQLHAGVSSFGVGGTNVHMVLSDHFQSPPPAEKNCERLIVLSAKTEKALQQNKENFKTFLANPNHAESVDLADIAYTLQTGREAFPWRCFGIGSSTEELISNLSLSKHSYDDPNVRPSVIFMFPGQGMQYHQMASQLMEEIPFFSELVKRGCDLANPFLGIDLLDVINNPSDARLNQTQYAQPALFIIEYALAKLLIHYGLIPSAMIGHSIGEYVAACIADIFSFEEAIALVCQRGLLMASAPPGEMLAIECTREELSSYLNHTELALHNADNYFVVTGDKSEINQLKPLLLKAGKPFLKLNTNHAFHSRMMGGIEQPFKALFSNLTLGVPKIPIISNVTGTWISPIDVTDCEYWYNQLRRTVQFCQGIETLLEKSHPLFIEVGPGQSLIGFLKEIAHKQKKKIVSAHTLPNRYSKKREITQMLSVLGTVWQQGIPIKWQSLYDNSPRRHVPLPTYAFQKQRYWIEPDFKELNSVSARPKMYIPVWSHQKAYTKSDTPIESAILNEHSWIIFSDENGLGDHLIGLLESKKIKPIVVRDNKTYSEKNARSFNIDLSKKDHYLKLFQAVKKSIKNPIILHVATYSDTGIGIPFAKAIDNQLALGFYSLLYLTQAYIEVIGSEVTLKVGVITTGTQQVLGTETMNPINATLNGSCRVIMQEQEGLKFKLIDLNPSEQPQKDKNLLSKIIDSCLTDEWDEGSLVRPYRNGFQWHLMYSVLTSQPKPMQRLKDKGIYLLTGGLGGIALCCCEGIIKTSANPTFILLSRRQTPPDIEWQSIIQNPTHPYYKKIKQICDLKKLGATVVIYQVDISQFELLDQVIRNVVSRFGTINGLIHTAGVANTELVEFKSSKTAQDVFLPKLHGTYNLIQLLKDIPLDFVILKSSLSALVGGFGQIDYCAANACLDAIATSELFSSCPFVVSINWNTWRDVGIAAEAALKGEATFLGKGNDISPLQGQDLFLRIVAGQNTQVAISNSDINFDTVLREQIHSNPSLSAVKIARQELNVTTDYQMPTNEMESKLAQLWQDLLGIEDIGVTDDFFALGGHSLKAISLIEKINAHFHCVLPATQIYTDPTIKQLCSTLLNASKNKPSNTTILLKQASNKPPYLFLCHPISGLINCFQPFVSQSDLPFSIYGLQDPSVTSNKMVYDSFETMVENYLSAIQHIQPIGPYYLIGYSFGGNVAYEIANRLQQQGQAVNLLALIDSWATYANALQNENGFKTHFKTGDNPLPKQLINLAWEREQLLLNHSLSTTHQEIVLFKASYLLDLYQSIEDPTNGWANYNKGKILCHTVDGNHETIINNKNSRTILHLIKRYLSEKYRIIDENLKERLN
jgi:amino acid adenylation domain-containing protein